MRGFIISLIIFAVMIGGIALYAVHWDKETEKLYEAASKCTGEACTENAVLIRKSINILEEKQVFFHTSLRKSKVNALINTLNAAYYYCREGNAEEMNRYVSDALKEIGEWREEEKLSLWNIL